MKQVAENVLCAGVECGGRNSSVRKRTVRAATTVAALCSLMVSSAEAQDAASPVVTAERMAVAGDTVGAIKFLQDAVERDKRDVAAWHKLGILAWSKARMARRPTFLPSEVSRLRIIADSALRMAAQMSPDSGRYWYDLSKYALNTGNVFVRDAANGFLENAQKALANKGDSALLSRVRDEQGMMAWRQYHSIAHRALVGMAPDYAPNTSDFKNGQQRGDGRPKDLPAPTAIPVQVRRDRWAGYIKEGLQPLNPPVGLPEFTKATNLFRAALQADPSNRLARQHLLMSLVEMSRWKELHVAAVDAVRRDSTFVEGWLARGLASARLNDMKDALIAFDVATTIMTPAQLQSFTDFKRLLPPFSRGQPSLFPDSVQYMQATPELQKRWETLYWKLADPRSTTDMNEAKLEHFARVAHADLLWSSDDFDLRGSDSDRGDVFIRYGPPARIANLVAGNQEGNPEGTHVLLWAYDNNLAFVFSMTAGYGTAMTASVDRAAVDSIREEVPVSWDNMKAAQRMVPMLIRAARFRATKDSMDVAIASAVPVLSLLKDSQLGGQLPIDVQIDIYDAQARTVGRQAQRATVPGENLPIGIDAWWLRRVGPGLNVIRVDAEQKDVERAAIATVEVAVSDSSGYGISDLLFTASPKARTSATPARWTDLDIKPNVGVFDLRQPIGLVWENYGLAPDGGNARYKVTIHLERTFKNRLRGLGARVFANVRSVMQGTSLGDGSMILTYDELRPHSDVIVEYLSVNLTESVPGTYRITVTIQDQVSGKSTKRSGDFTLVK